MRFSYNWLQTFFQKKLPKPEKLAELLTMYSFEVSAVERLGKDFVLDIDVLPNRASDCFSHIGIAREISAITNLKCTGPTRAIKEDKKIKAKDFVSIEVKNRGACPRYTARVITDVKVGPSPKWIQDCLKVCGFGPINNIVDIANYIMLETGQPLHAFDGEKLEEKKIVVRFAKKREKIVTLDEEKYDLDENILVIADTKNSIAIAGIKGGKIPEIDKKTKTVVLESANFNPQVIRKGSKELGLKTDASLRFEHGIDSNLTELAINRVAYLIQKISKSKVTKGLIDFYPQKALPKKIKLDLNYAEGLLGVKIPKKEIKNILKKLNFKIGKVKPCQIEERKLSSPAEPHDRELRREMRTKFSANPFAKAREIEVGVPTWRLDVSIQEDLIEEIGRMAGFEKIPATFPVVSLIPPKRNLDIFWEDMAKDILKEAGFTEVYNYSFVSEKDISIYQFTPIPKFGVRASQHKSAVIEVENPTSEDFKYLRPSLICNLLKNVQKNQKYVEKIEIFELGKIFKKSKVQSPKFKVEEKRMLTGLVSGDAFYQTKGVVDLLLQKLGISNIWYDEYQPTPEESRFSIWHPKKCAEIKVNHTEIGFLGEIKPAILENFKIEDKVVIFDLDFEKLSKLVSEEHEYLPISRHPAAVRDLAVLVPRGTRIEEVLNKIEAAGGPLIRDIDLFDIYEGEEIPREKKNLAFHIIYQAENRTLTSEEIDEIQNKIIKALEKKPEWQVRK